MLLSLPIEILALVVSYLPLEDIPNLAQCNKTAAQLIRSMHLWSYLVLGYSPDPKGDYFSGRCFQLELVNDYNKSLEVVTDRRDYIRGFVFIYTWFFLQRPYYYAQEALSCYLKEPFKRDVPQEVFSSKSYLGQDPTLCLDTLKLVSLTQITQAQGSLMYRMGLYPYRYSGTCLYLHPIYLVSPTTDYIAGIKRGLKHLGIIPVTEEFQLCI
jgi:hypothetical protein